MEENKNVNDIDLKSLTKKELLEVAILLQNSSILYDRVLKKYNLCKQARKEDATKVKDAETVLSNHDKQVLEINNYYQQQIAYLKGEITSQNETIVDLFDTLNDTINSSNKLYQKYRKQFISYKKVENNQEEEK